MRFTLTIDFGNDAMQTADDLASALPDLANRIADSLRHGHWTSGGVADANGNRVGRWDLTGKPEDDE